jgi:hypothetical protein
MAKKITGPDSSMLFNNETGTFEDMLNIAGQFATASSTFTPYSLIGPAVNIAAGMFGNNKAKDVPKMGREAVNMMPTKWDINPQLTANAEGAANMSQTIKNNMVGPGVSSSVNKLYATKLLGDSQAYGTKNNAETQMRAQKAQTLQRVEAIDNQNQMKQWQAQMAYDDNAGALGNFSRAGINQLGNTGVQMVRDQNAQRTNLLSTMLTATAFAPKYNAQTGTGTGTEGTGVVDPSSPVRTERSVVENKLAPEQPQQEPLPEPNILRPQDGMGSPGGLGIPSAAPAAPAQTAPVETKPAETAPAAPPITDPSTVRLREGRSIIDTQYTGELPSTAAPIEQPTKKEKPPREPFFKRKDKEDDYEKRYNKWYNSLTPEQQKEEGIRINSLEQQSWTEERRLNMSEDGVDGEGLPLSRENLAIEEKYKSGWYKKDLEEFNSITDNIKFEEEYGKKVREQVQEDIKYLSNLPSNKYDNFNTRILEELLDYSENNPSIAYTRLATLAPNDKTMLEELLRALPPEKRKFYDDMIEKGERVAEYLAYEYIKQKPVK